MQYYIIIVFATILLALNFAVTKKYQKEQGATIESGLKFNIISGAISGLLFFFLNGFKLEITAFSLAMITAMLIFAISYSLLGFKIMEGGKIALYIMFLMSGGMVVPYVWGILFLNEPLTILRSIGLILIIAAVVICNGDNSKFDKKQVLLCCLVFVLNGFTSVVSKEHQINPKATSTINYVILEGLMKSILSLIVLIIIKTKQKFNNPTITTINIKRFNGLTLLILSASAIINGCSFLLQLIGAHELPATVLYPIITGGTIIFTAIAGRIFFKEKITSKLAFGICICFIGTCLFL